MSKWRQELQIASHMAFTNKRREKCRLIGLLPFAQFLHSYSSGLLAKGIVAPTVSGLGIATSINLIKTVLHKHATVQPNVKTESLVNSSQVILVCIKMTVKANCSNNVSRRTKCDRSGLLSQHLSEDQGLKASLNSILYLRPCWDGSLSQKK